MVMQQAQQAQQPVEEPDFHSEPDKAVRRAVERELAPLHEDFLEVRQLKMDAKLRAAHNDYVEVVQDQGFQQWVADSPIRIELFARADRNYDANSAIELISMYKATHPKQSGEDSASSEARQQALSNGQMESG